MKHKHNETTVARTIILVKSGIDYTRFMDLEPDLNSIKWIVVKLKNRCCDYRLQAVVSAIRAGFQREQSP